MVEGISEHAYISVQEAINWLREKGISKAAKKASRIAAEGLAVVKIDGNKALISLSFKQNSKDRLFLKINNKNNNQNQKNKSNFYKKQNRNDKMNKSQYNKITMSFLDFDEDNKENDEIKMKKIFHDLKDVIQEDENFLIKNKFANYGYNKDIIFAVDKRHVINRNEENKNHNYTFNNSDIKVRPYSKSFKRH